MKIKKVFYLLSMLILFISCTSEPIIINVSEKPESEKTETDNNTVIDEQEDSEQEINIDVVKYNVPGKENENEESEKNPKKIVKNNKVKYTVTPTTKDFLGGAVSYNYVPYTIYDIFIAPYNTTEIHLQPGEKMISPPVCGDTFNFMLGSGISASNNIQQEILYLKAIYSGKETTLSINTNKRIYNFTLYSVKKDEFMPIVRFNYPLEEFKNKIKENQNYRNEIVLSTNITSLNYSYKIIPGSIHKPTWMPHTCFDDGIKTYIYFPSVEKLAEAPSLFIIKNKKRILANYRVAGSYYVIDQLFDRAILLLSNNSKDTVTITRIK